MFSTLNTKTLAYCIEHEKDKTHSIFYNELCASLERPLAYYLALPDECGADSNRLIIWRPWIELMAVTTSRSLAYGPCLDDFAAPIDFFLNDDFEFIATQERASDSGDVCCDVLECSRR